MERTEDLSKRKVFKMNKVWKSVIENGLDMMEKVASKTDTPYDDLLVSSACMILRRVFNLENKDS